jgi:hypothetical protein
MRCDFLLKRRPVPQFGRRDVPEVKLELSLRRRTTFVRFIRALRLRHFTAGLDRSVVDRLEDLLVKQTRLRRIERHAQDHERVRESLNTKANRTMTHV